MENDQKNHGITLAKWNFPEYQKQERSKGWYVMASIIVVLMLFYAMVTVNFLFAVIIIISAIILIMRERFEPEQITFSITEDGLELDEKFYDWDMIRYFYIIYKPPENKNLYFEFKSITKPRLNIPLANQNPLDIRDVLKKYIDENLEKEIEPATEAWKKLLKL